MEVVTTFTIIINIIITVSKASHRSWIIQQRTQARIPPPQPVWVLIHMPQWPHTMVVVVRLILAVSCQHSHMPPTHITHTWIWTSAQLPLRARWCRQWWRSRTCRIPRWWPRIFTQQLHSHMEVRTAISVRSIITSTTTAAMGIPTTS